MTYYEPRRTDGAQHPYRGETYYGRPAVKSSPFDWRISAYIFIGGLAGSSQIIAAAGERLDPEGTRGMVRNARYLSLGASAVGPLLLIADLHTKQRWYNMLRIFRPTSPMSIGSYILSGFGLFSSIAAAGQFLDDRRGGTGRSLPGRAARAAQIPAAVAGAGMSTYTAALLSATSTPLWAAAPQLLATRFGTSAMASAAAALSLGEQIAGRPENGRRLDRLALAAVTGELAASKAADRVYRERGVAGVLEERPFKTMHERGAVALGTVAPIVGHGANAVSNRPSPALSILGSLAILAGAAIMRQTVLKAGNRSAQRPADYFRFTQPARPPRHGPAFAGRAEPPERRLEGGDRPLRPAAAGAEERKPETIAVEGHERR